MALLSIKILFIPSLVAAKMTDADEIRAAATTYLVVVIWAVALIMVAAQITGAATEDSQRMPIICSILS